jgi:outer membrane receptor for ferrienterochelin and colicin
MCKDRIEELSVGFEEISFASWDIPSKTLSIKAHKDFEVMNLHEALAAIGHDTELVRGCDTAYANLHSCCKYRDEAISNENALERFKNWDENADHSNDVHGVISELTKEGEKIPVIGATVNWLGTTIASATDEQGFFTLEKVKDIDAIVLNYVGSLPDTIEMGNQHIVNIVIKSNFILDEVSITHKKKTTEISFLNTMKVRQIDKKELLKAACCSLSESFETTPSVDVSFTDAVTGTRKIELLGLAGPNVQIMHENIPYVRGLAALNGLDLIPGPWVESMQLNIGSGSVVNGPEALTGQINVETKKPRESEKAYVSLYGNIMQRFELNANTTTNINDQLSTAFIVHAAQQNGKHDRNFDGFLDNPLSNQIFVLNRWKLRTKNNLQSQLGFKYSMQNKLSGQHEKLHADHSHDPIEEYWQANQQTDRLDSWFKMGKVFENNPNRSFGFMMNYTYHNQQSQFGLKPYNAAQNSFYTNLIFSQLIEGTGDKLNYGVSFQYDNFEEHLNVNSYLRNETLPGIFTEYNTSYGEKWDFVFGLRGDYHNNYGFLVNPRMHAKYSPSDTKALRFSAGRGIRTPTIFAENPGIFVSSRDIIVLGETDTPYGLGQEIAWNAGMSYTQEVIINKRSLIFGGEYYYTFFENNVLLDFDTDVNAVSIYNVENGTSGHSIQLHAEYEIIENLSVKTAYRFNDVRSDYLSGRLLKPLISRHRAFVNVSAELPKRWNIDGTFNLQGRKRIPNTSANPIEFQLEEYSPTFYTINGQISKFFNKGFEAYIGVENLLDFRQNDAIIDSFDPFGEYFDSSLIWGPIMGRNIYIGARYRLF